MLTVVKVGGSLSREPEGLADLCRHLGRLGGSHPLLVVPGGAAFADTVRDQGRRFQLRETTSHWMALLAMDQHGHVLSDLIPGSRLSRSLASARLAIAEGRTPILLPSTLLRAADPLPHSWEVTSDSIAAWIAGLARATRLVLLKDVEGLFVGGPERGDIASELSVEDLVDLQRRGRIGGVDQHLATVLTMHRIECWVISGRHPGRTAALIGGETPPGTRIASGSMVNGGTQARNQRGVERPRPPAATAGR